MDSNHLIERHHSAIHYPKYIVKMDGLKELKVDDPKVLKVDGLRKMDIVLKILGRGKTGRSNWV